LENRKIALGAIMKRQVRIVSVFILVTFLFSAFLIPVNINARVYIQREVSFGEPGSERGWTSDLLPNNVTSSNEILETECSFKNDPINIWHLYSEVIFRQVFTFLSGTI
jgi:hypothetical protein